MRLVMPQKGRMPHFPTFMLVQLSSWIMVWWYWAAIKKTVLSRVDFAPSGLLCFLLVPIILGMRSSLWLLLPKQEAHFFKSQSHPVGHVVRFCRSRNIVPELLSIFIFMGRLMSFICEVFVRCCHLRSVSDVDAFFIFFHFGNGCTFHVALRISGTRSRHSSGSIPFLGIHPEKPSLSSLF